MSVLVHCAGASYTNHLTEHLKTEISNPAFGLLVYEIAIIACNLWCMSRSFTALRVID